MRFQINLATEPYEVAKQYKRLITSVLLGLGLVAIVLLGYIVHQRLSSRDINRKIAAAQAEIAALNHEKAQAQSLLNRPSNREVADESQFLNELFARKALSWTRVFTEMEKIMPYNLRVVSMKPDYTKDNQLMLHMVVATDSRDRAVELVRRMEKSNHFRLPEIVAETVTTSSSAQAGSSGNIQFDIASLYVPFVQDDAAGNADEKKAEGDEGNQEPPSAKKPPVPKSKTAKPATAAPGRNVRTSQNQPPKGAQ